MHPSTYISQSYLCFYLNLFCIPVLSLSLFALFIALYSHYNILCLYILKILKILSIMLYWGLSLIWNGKMLIFKMIVTLRIIKFCVTTICRDTARLINASWRIFYNAMRHASQRCIKNKDRIPATVTFTKRLQSG